MSALQVGLSKVKDNVTQSLRVYRYSDVPNSSNWIDCTQFLPLAFDIMYLRLKDRFRHVAGWWNGSTWEGLRLRDGDKITHWKRNLDCD